MRMIKTVASFNQQPFIYTLSFAYGIFQLKWNFRKRPPYTVGIMFSAGPCPWWKSFCSVKTRKEDPDGASSFGRSLKNWKIGSLQGIDLGKVSGDVEKKTEDGRLSPSSSISLISPFVMSVCKEYTAPSFHPKQTVQKSVCSNSNRNMAS